jgi:hypothetical protein
MSNVELDAIEKNIQEAQAYVDAANALLKLKDNREFKKVIMKGYFEEEAVRLVHLKADSNMQTPDMQKSLDKQIEAIGSFSNYLNTVLYKAEMARKTIEAEEEAREEILQNESDI